MGDVLTIRLFLLGSALTVALEAYKATPRARVGLGALAVLLAVLGFAYTLITGLVPVVGSTFAALIGSPASWFTLAVALFLVLRPYWAAPQIIPTEVPAPYDDTDLKDQLRSLAKHVENVLAAFEGLASESKKADEVEARLLAEVDNLKLSLQSLEKQYGDNLTIVQRSSAENVTAVTMRLDEADAKLRRELNNIWLALAAIYDRERLTRLSDQIDEVAIGLTNALTNGRTLDPAAWEGWRQASKAWAAIVAEWITIADRYERGAGDTIAKLHEEMLESEWSVKAAQFPLDNGLHHYQKFRIRYRNWQGVRDRVNDRIRRAAFEGQAEAILRGEVR